MTESSYPVEDVDGVAAAVVETDRLSWLVQVLETVWLEAASVAAGIEPRDYYLSRPHSLRNPAQTMMLNLDSSVQELRDSLGPDVVVVPSAVAGLNC